MKDKEITVGEQTKMFYEYLDRTYDWIDSDVKRIAQKAWFAAVKANGIKHKNGKK